MERILGEDINVSTNAVEGLFGRLKSYLRQRRYGRAGKNNYGHLLAEFLWRQQCSAHQADPFRRLLAESKEWQDDHPSQEPVSFLNYRRM